VKLGFAVADLCLCFFKWQIQKWQINFCVQKHGCLFDRFVAGTCFCRRSKEASSKGSYKQSSLLLSSFSGRLELLAAFDKFPASP